MAMIYLRYVVGALIGGLIASIVYWRRMTRHLNEEQGPVPSRTARLRHSTPGKLVLELTGRDREGMARLVAFELPAAMAMELGRALSVEGALSWNHQGQPEQERGELGRPARGFSADDSERRARESEQRTQDRRRVQCPECGLWWRYKDEKPPERCSHCDTSLSEAG